jgi:hypothetical protein
MIEPHVAAMNLDLIPGLPVDLIHSIYADAPGNELASGKFGSPESSSALVANTFGLFLNRPADLPEFRLGRDMGWPATSVRLEAVVRFPWAGGRHPCLDVLIQSPTALIGVESKRYEPFRAKATPELSDAYWRPVWGNEMTGFARVRDRFRDGTCHFRRLDAAQLIKHAFGLRTAVHRAAVPPATKAVLLYVHAEPTCWPDGRSVPAADIELHRCEVEQFADLVAGDEVSFRVTTYRELLATWHNSPVAAVREHAATVRGRFDL